MCSIPKQEEYGRGLCLPEPGQDVCAEKFHYYLSRLVSITLSLELLYPQALGPCVQTSILSTEKIVTYDFRALD